MARLDDLARRGENALLAVHERQEYTVLTGLRVDDTTVTLNGAQTGKVWVRSYDESREQWQVWGYASLSNATVFVRKDRKRGDYLTGRIDYETTMAALGEAGAAALVVRGMDETTPHSIPGQGFTPGRVGPGTNGFPYIHVGAFHYDGGFWDDGAYDRDLTLYDFDVTAYIPITSGYSSWTRIYLFDGTLSAASGAEQFGDVTMLAEADIEDIAIPAGAIPLGAIGMSDTVADWTTAATSRFTDARYHLTTAEHNQWIIDYTSVIPLGAVAVIPRGLRIASTGSLTVDGGLYII